MSLILSIDTSSNGCSVALHKAGVLLANSELFAQRSSAEMLTVLIADTLKVAKKSFEDLAAVAISKGPGSYTGLRIGVSTAKGLCYAKDLPLVSINTLDSMAAQIPAFFKGAICPMLDARRMEVYCKIVNGAEEMMPTSAVIVEEGVFDAYLSKGPVLFCGEGAEKCKPLLTHENALFMGDEIRPRAVFMGESAFDKFEKGEFEDVSAFEPYYLKEFLTTVAKNKKVTA